MHNDELFQPEQAGAYLGGVPTTTLQWWRTVGRGPAYVKIGRRVLYRKSALDAELTKGARNPEPEAA